MATTYPETRYDGRILSGLYVGASFGMGPGSRRTAVLVYLNGIEVNQEEVMNLPLEDVESMAYVSRLSAAPFQYGTSFFGLS